MAPQVSDVRGQVYEAVEGRQFDFLGEAKIFRHCLVDTSKEIHLKPREGF